MRTQFFCSLTLFALALACLTFPLCASESRLPNIIFVLADNLGSGDLGCYGSMVHRTPHLDQMALDGTRFSNFYVTSGVCTPSRASILTGCYAQRLNMHISDKGASVLQPVAAKGLHSNEATIAEQLKSRGYTCACFGKWHLGDQPAFLPTRQGFDEFLGVPYSEDMVRDLRPSEWPELPLMQNEKVIEAPVDCEKLTRIYTPAACRFIETHKDSPFFLYMPQARPGSTKVVHVGSEFRGKSANGLYGDSVEELDWSLGEVRRTLEEQGLTGKTLVIWTSDNGAVQRNPQQGSNAPYRGWGYSTTEGGMRMPLIISWPGHIPAGRLCDDMSTSLDFFKSLSAIVGVDMPDARVRDGFDVRPIWLNEPGAESPYAEHPFYFYHMAELQAVRQGDWKLYLPLPERKAANGRVVPAQPLRLFDVRHDVSEDHEASQDHPEIVAQLTAAAEQARADLGDRDRIGEGQRSAGLCEHPTPRIPEAN